MYENFLDFEKPIAEIKKKLDSIDRSSLHGNNEYKDLEKKIENLYIEIYSNLTPWQKVQLARHPERPHTSDYIKHLISEFIPLAGDRKFSEDESIIGGLGKFNETSVVVLGTEKGNSMESRIKHNFGMARPDGYRKVQRLYKLASRFNLPIITFVDTAGAYPGKEAEQRGQAEAIAKSMLVSLRIESPMISIIIGEGGSGGAIALATTDKVLMLENSIYSVISPEGCASILWRDPSKVQVAADSLNLTASHCKKFGIIDEIINEFPGGAHRNYLKTIESVGNSISNNLKQLIDIEKNQLVSSRNNKFLNITSNIF
jgi:acetyl-CoA carboxylase carboxyl transferase subunit alpha